MLNIFIKLNGQYHSDILWIYMIDFLDDLYKIHNSNLRLVTQKLVFWVHQYSPRYSFKLRDW